MTQDIQDSDIPEELPEKWETADMKLSDVTSFFKSKEEKVEPPKSELHDKIVLVTGGRGFLGTKVCEHLESLGAKPIAFRSGEFDLVSYESARSCFNTHRPDYVIHCAGHNGGIQFNRQFPADILHKNTMMALNIHALCNEFNVKKIVSVITSCAYPDKKQEVLEEDTLWEGQPNDTIKGHGIAKRMLQACAEQYHNQYGLNAVTVAITNLYGPNDTFNLTRTKVVGAVIRKVVEAKQNDSPEVECWGTGKPLREFMYVDDAAVALVQSLLLYENHTQPLNIGSNQEVSIKELTEHIVDYVEYEGNVIWNTDKPDGQMKKLLDTSTMRNLLPVKPIDFEDGLYKTIDWYVSHKKEADEKP